MDANAFRHFYDYHFAENRKIWDLCVTQLSDAQFTQPVNYSHGSVRDQIVHLISCEETWFSELRGADPCALIPASDIDNREIIRARWNGVEESMRAYLTELRDDTLFARPIKEPEEDKDLIVWQVLLHVANHATDHRAQLLRVLNDLGVQAGYQDYIFYVYDHPVHASREVFVNKSELLHWLQEEYRGWEGLLEEIGPERMEQPGVNGAWSMKDMLAHLTGYQPRVNTSLQAALRGESEPPPPWPAHLQTDDEINAWIYQSNRGRSLDEVLDESRRIVQQFLEIVKEFPEDVQIEQVHKGDRVYYLVWLGGQRYQPGELFDHFHDDHEPDIRAWLARLENRSSATPGGSK